VGPALIGRLARTARALLIAAGVAAVSTAGLGWFWGAIGGGELSLHGWIAMTLGIVGTVALGWLLMSLAFRSHRDGWDDQVDNRLDPGRDLHDL
jgi:hypothetical protein